MYMYLIQCRSRECKSFLSAICICFYLNQILQNVSQFNTNVRQPPFPRINCINLKDTPQNPKNFREFIQSARRVHTIRTFSYASQCTMYSSTLFIFLHKTACTCTCNSIQYLPNFINIFNVRTKPPTKPCNNKKI